MKDLNNLSGNQLDSLPITVIKPSRGRVPIDFDELWHYRELLCFLVWRNVKIRYKQTVLGAAWAIIQPFFIMVVFSVFFGRLAHISSEGLPYAIFAYSALVPWFYFSEALTQASNSIIEYQSIITKVYFPRAMLPLASVLSSLVDFAVAFTVLIGMMFFYGIVPTNAIWLSPLFLFIAVLMALGVSLWFSALNVEYRDVRYTIPFLIQLWLFITPVVYSSTLVPEKWRLVYGLNPMVGVIEGFRWTLLGKPISSVPMLITSSLVVFLIFLGGLRYFCRMEKTFADIV